MIGLNIAYDCSDVRESVVVMKSDRVNNQNKMDSLEFDFEAVFEVDDYLYFYSDSLTDERTETEVKGIANLLELGEPKEILDLACGFGRHTNRLAAMGHRMTGIDLTPGFLEIARREALEKHLEVVYQQGDMRELGYQNQFDHVLLLFTAFGYFSDEENQQVLLNVRNALRPGGCIIFDAPNRDTFLKTLRPYIVVEKDSNLMIDRITFDPLQGRSYDRRIVIRDGVRKDKPFTLRLYNATDIHSLIERAGLVLEHIFGNFDASAFTQDSTRMVVVARKPQLV